MKKLTLEECKEFAKNKNGECLSDVYIGCKTNMKWKCHNGHEWEARFDDIKNSKSWCPKCQKLSLEDCKQFAKNKGGECLSDKYINNDTNMKWKCHNNHEWEGDI